jgi:hypothetical protein
VVLVSACHMRQNFEHPLSWYHVVIHNVNKIRTLCLHTFTEEESAMTRSRSTMK